MLMLLCIDARLLKSVLLVLEMLYVCAFEPLRSFNLHPVKERSSESS